MMHAKQGAHRSPGRRDIEHDVRTGPGPAQQTQLQALRGGGLMEARAGVVIGWGVRVSGPLGGPIGRAARLSLRMATTGCTEGIQWSLVTSA